MVIDRIAWLKLVASDNQQRVTGDDKFVDI